MRWLVLLLLITPVAAQAPSGLEVTIEEQTFGYGPEDWKADRPITDQTSLTEQAAGWNASLGAYLDLHVRAEPVEGNAGNDWEYEATLSDGVTEVSGRITPDPAGRFYVRFDIDGQRALPGLAAIPPLVPGEWTLHVRAMTGDRPEGSGTTRIDTSGIDPLPVTADEDEVAGIPFPEDLLPQTTEVGPGSTVWLNARAMPAGPLFRFAVAGSTAVTWTAWTAGLGLPVPEPVPGQTQWQRHDLDAIATADGSMTGLAFEAGTQAMVIIAAVGQEGGVAVWALGLTDHQASVQAVEAPAPGEAGSAVFTIASEAGPGRLLGEAFALGISDTAAPLLAQTVVVQQDMETSSASFDARTLRAAGTPYRMVALLHDQGRYGGHAVLDRGLDVDLQVPTLGAGREATVLVRLTSLSEGDLPAPEPGLVTRAELRLAAGEDSLVLPVELVEGATIEVPFPITPEQEGTLRIEATIDTGDTTQRLDHVAPVLSLEAYDEQEAPWYDIPGPSVLLLALALLGRKR